MYSDIVMDHFYSPRNGRRMERPDVIGKAGDPERGGPFMLLYLRVRGERIEEATFQTYGCGPAIAAGSLLTEKIAGEAVAAARVWDEDAIERALGGLPMQKRHCARIAAEALSDALGRLDATRAPIGRETPGTEGSPEPST